MERRALLLTKRDLPPSWQFTPTRLRETLKLSGLTYSEAADLLDVSRSGLIKWGSSDGTDMPDTMWNYWLLLLDLHPFYRLSATVAGEGLLEAPKSGRKHIIEDSND